MDEEEAEAEEAETQIYESGIRTNRKRMRDYQPRQEQQQQNSPSNQDLVATPAADIVNDNDDTMKKVRGDLLPGFDINYNTSQIAGGLLSGGGGGLLASARAASNMTTSGATTAAAAASFATTASSMTTPRLIYNESASILATVINQEKVHSHYA